MCGGCAPATGINSPPEGGVHGPPARFACAVPAAPRALPGWGLAPPRPPGLRPLVRLRAPGPCCLGRPVGGGSGHGCDGGGGGQPLEVVPARRLAPPPLPWIQFFKRWAVRMHGGGLGGRAPRCRATVGNPAQAVGGQGAAAGCARRPRTGRGCPRATGFRAQRSRLFGCSSAVSKVDKEGDFLKI